MLLTMKPDRAKPLERVVVSRASAGMTPWRGVYVNEKTTLKR
jgi:hypothetical protein